MPFSNPLISHWWNGKVASVFHLCDFHCSLVSRGFTWVDGCSHLKHTHARTLTHTQKRERNMKTLCQASPQFAPRWTHDRFYSFLLMWISSLLAKPGNIPLSLEQVDFFIDLIFFFFLAQLDLSCCTLPRLSHKQVWFLCHLADRGHFVQLCFGLQSLGDGLCFEFAE